MPARRGGGGLRCCVGGSGARGGVSRIASDASDDATDALVSETADACAEAIERADALTAPAATGGA